MSINSINTNWFSIDKEDKEYIIESNSNIDYNILELTKRIDSCENTLKSIEKTLEDLKSQLDIFYKEDQETKKQLQEIQTKVKANEKNCNVIRNENLTLINRILQAEISVERTTNILLRKNISFPFTKLNL